MATKALKDLRRNDQRDNTLANPFWLTSAEIDATCDDKAAILFAFPKDDEDFFIHETVVEVVEAFAGGTITLDIGAGSIETAAAVDGDDCTYTAVDGYAANTDVTEGTVGFYALAASERTFIEGAATTVPVVAAHLVSDAAITAGKARVHMLVSRMP